MEQLRDHKVFLEMLMKSNPRHRKGLLSGAPPQIIHLLGECALNILRGTITLTQKEKSELRKHKTKLRKIANPNVSNQTKKKVMQKGGALVPLMLKPVLKAVIPILADQLVKSL